MPLRAIKAGIWSRPELDGWQILTDPTFDAPRSPYERGPDPRPLGRLAAAGSVLVLTTPVRAGAASSLA